jgi:hypothetical protein
MPTLANRIGNQMICHLPSNLPIEFALRNASATIERFSEKGSAGWVGDDVNPMAVLRE